MKFVHDRIEHPANIWMLVIILKRYQLDLHIIVRGHLFPTCTLLLLLLLFFLLTMQTFSYSYLENVKRNINAAREFKNNPLSCVVYIYFIFVKKFRSVLLQFRA
mgnify:CR=1 FL=1